MPTKLVMMPVSLKLVVPPTCKLLVFDDVSAEIPKEAAGAAKIVPLNVNVELDWYALVPLPYGM